MELAAPGIKKEYCRVAINDEGNLTIAIENKQEHKHEDSHHHYLRREFIIKAPTCVCKSGPFYAVRVKPAIHHTMGGLSVNTETQVLRADGTPIGGLYAAGEVTGGLPGANRLGGNGVADIVVNGRLAGLAASKRLARSDHP